MVVCVGWFGARGGVFGDFLKGGRGGRRGGRNE